MTEVVILGAGNLANHLFQALELSNKIRVVQVYNRSEASLQNFKNLVDTTTKLADLKVADFYIVALKDDAIHKVVDKMNIKSGIVLHTSGAKPIGLLSKFKDFGILYPLQSFSKETSINFKEVPLLFEANSASVLEKLKGFATAISDNIYEVNSEQRKAIHVAAVFANNFTNHMYQIASEICETYKVPFSILNPLIEKTANKINEMSPLKAQTGPAVRSDLKTIKAHLELLNSEQQTIYKQLTNAIQSTHGKKL